MDLHRWKKWWRGLWRRRGRRKCEGKVAGKERYGEVGGLHNEHFSVDLS